MKKRFGIVGIYSIDEYIVMFLRLCLELSALDQILLSCGLHVEMHGFRLNKLINL